MGTLPKPSKTVNFKGLKISLFQSPVLLKMLGKSRDTFIIWENAGLIPAPLFMNGTRRYYMSFELQALRDVISMHGIPRMELEKENNFIIDLKQKWGVIRAHVLNGKYPPVSLKLEFENRDSYVKSFKEALSVFGIRGEVQAENAADELLRRAQIL